MGETVEISLPSQLKLWTFHRSQAFYPFVSHKQLILEDASDDLIADYSLQMPSSLSSKIKSEPCYKTQPQGNPEVWVH